MDRVYFLVQWASPGIIIKNWELACDGDNLVNAGMLYLVVMHCVLDY